MQLGEQKMAAGIELFKIAQSFENGANKTV